ncbi:hypothetical protein AYX15_00368 [Cryptococcus neoformans]|nr:hypothetical protein AYX15_00368 [Cryptococcus neoformans var. grubii]
MSTIRRFLDSQSRAVVAAGAIMVAAAALWITSDYRDWIAFGTGGTPSNPMGYLKMRKFWLKRLFINDDLTDGSSLPDEGPSYLPANVPPREGGRPEKMPR